MGTMWVFAIRAPAVAVEGTAGWVGGESHQAAAKTAAPAARGQHSGAVVSGAGIVAVGLRRGVIHLHQRQTTGTQYEGVALAKGMGEKSKEFVEKGAEVYAEA